MSREIGRLSKTLRVKAISQSFPSQAYRRPVRSILSSYTGPSPSRGYTQVLASTKPSQRFAPALLSWIEPCRYAGHSVPSDTNAKQLLHNDLGTIQAIIIPNPRSPTASSIPPISILSRLTPLPSLSSRQSISTPTTESTRAISHEVVNSNPIEQSSDRLSQINRQNGITDWPKQDQTDSAGSLMDSWSE